MPDVEQGPGIPAPWDDGCCGDGVCGMLAFCPVYNRSQRPTQDPRIMEEIQRRLTELEESRDRASIRREYEGNWTVDQPPRREGEWTGEPIQYEDAVQLGRTSDNYATLTVRDVPAGVDITCALDMVALLTHRDRVLAVLNEMHPNGAALSLTTHADLLGIPAEPAIKDVAVCSEPCTWQDVGECPVHGEVDG